MATTFTPIQGKRIRITQLDDCGKVPEQANFIASKGFVRVQLGAETEDGNEITVKRADGTICVNEKQNDAFKYMNVEIQFCGVHPDLYGMVSNALVYEDYNSNSVGFTLREGDIKGKFAFEMWSGLAGQDCGEGGESSGYLLLPQLVKGVVGDMEFTGEDAVDFTVTGTRTKGGNQWGVGPYNVMAGVGTDNVQKVKITGTPTGGEFVLNFKGRSTEGIAHNATAQAVEEALEELLSIGDGNVTVTKAASTFTVTFGGRLAGTVQPLITATKAFTGGTNPDIEVTEEEAGGPGEATTLPTPLDPLDHFMLIYTKAAPPAHSDEVQQI